MYRLSPVVGTPGLARERIESNTPAFHIIHRGQIWIETTCMDEVGRFRHVFDVEPV